MGKVATSPRAASVIPSASKRGAKSEVAHKWARWLHHPCHASGIPPGGRGDVARIPTASSGGQNQKWPINGQGATSPLLIPALGGSRPLHSGGQNQIPAASKRVAKWATSDFASGIPPLQSGGQNQNGP